MSEILNKYTNEIICKDEELSIKELAQNNNANLVNANLEDANLRNANLEDANLRNANLENANLRNANL